MHHTLIRSNLFNAEHQLDPNNIVIKADNLKVDNSLIDSNTATSGNSGNLYLIGGDIEVNHSQLKTTTYDGGTAGDIEIMGSSVAITNTGIYSFTRTYRPLDSDISTLTTYSDVVDGNAGDITVVSRQLLLDGGEIHSDSTGYGNGDAGRISIIGDRLTIKNNGAISSSTGTDGDAGRVDIVSKSIRLESEGGIYASTAGSGQGGTVDVKADNLVMLSKSFISSAAIDRGDAGDVRVAVDGTLTIQGTGLPIYISGPGGDGTLISSESYGAGRAGDVFVSASRLRLKRGAYITSAGSDAGAAGNVTVRAGTLEATNGSITTAGTGAEGGRIAVGRDRPHLPAPVGGDLQRHRGRATGPA